MNKNFNLADIKHKPEAIQRLTEAENEMGKELGGDIVLIAYKRIEDRPQE